MFIIHQFYKVSALISVLLEGEMCSVCVSVRAWLCRHLWKSWRNISIKQIILYISFILLAHLIITEKIHVDTQNKLKLHVIHFSKYVAAIASDSNYSEILTISLKIFLIFNIYSFPVWCCLNAVMFYFLKYYFLFFIHLKSSDVKLDAHWWRHHNATQNFCIK